MVTTLAAIALVHVAAFSCVLLMARYSVMLVDEDGRPIQRTSDWYEQVIPSLKGGPVRIARRDR